jgi:hypothetical protein
MHLEYAQNCQSHFVNQARYRTEQFIVELVTARQAAYNTKKTKNNATVEFMITDQFQYGTTWPNTHGTVPTGFAVFCLYNCAFMGSKCT